MTFPSYPPVLPVLPVLPDASLPRVPGSTVLATFPPDVRVVGMVSHKGQVIVATSQGVYRLVHGRLKPIPLDAVPA